MSDEQIWAFSDVDDMLIATVRECPVAGSEVAAVDDKGKICGWLTPKQRQFLSMFAGKVGIVLTTARTSKGVSQLSLPISGYWAIVSFGGVILTPEGTVEPRYRAIMGAHAKQAAPTLSRLLALMQETCQTRGIDARCRVAQDDGMDLFLSVKHNKRDISELAQLKDVLAPELPQGWTLHFNGNFLAALPPQLNKESAVRWFIDNIAGADALAIGMGDSLTDLSFMGLCDIAIMPTRSQSFSYLTKEISHD